MSLLERLQHIPDPRIHRRRRHDLIDLLAIALCATIGGADNWVEVAQFGQAHHDWFKRFLRLPSGIASHDTFARVFRLLDEQALEAACLEWMRSAAGQVKGVVAIDGKTVCGATPAGSARPALHMLSAWAADMGVLLGQCKVDGKSNEITAIPKLLKLLDVQGCIVTIDAMGCQKAIAEHIVQQNADYVLTLKAPCVKLVAAPPVNTESPPRSALHDKNLSLLCIPRTSLAQSARARLAQRPRRCQ